MKKGKAKEPVRLRERKLKGGNVSLYLDIYDRGSRRYEFLRLYLVPERTREDRMANHETLRLANAIKAERVVGMQRGAHGFAQSGGNVPLVPYMRKLADGFKAPGTRTSWNSCIRLVAAYDGRRTVTLRDVTRRWVEGFREFVDSRDVKQNTKSLYWSKFRAAVNSALREGIIAEDPMRGVKGFAMEETEREHLTPDELRLLVRTKGGNAAMRSAFLFSCLTGMRFSDISKLTWADVREDGDGCRIVFRQQKTRGQEYLDVNDEARSLLGRRGEGRVFALPPLTCVNRALKTWVKRAGIRKNISFHCARHTFAITLLNGGVDLYTVSKLLGHRDISTTQIYARVVDNRKREAMGRLPSILGGDGD